MARTFPDDLDRRILDELRNDARLSYRAIARALGKSPPVIAERIKRMEQVGLIRGYHVETALDPGKGEARAAPLVCAECKDAILGPARAGTVGGHARVFCCKVCRQTFEDRFKRASAKAGKALTAWTLVAASVLTGALGSTCLASPGCSTMPTPTAWHPNCVPGTDARRLDAVRRPAYGRRLAAAAWSPVACRTASSRGLSIDNSASFIPHPR